MAICRGQAVTDLVVVVPGILGSRLFKNGKEVWGTTSRQLLVNLLTFGHFMKSTLAISADADPNDPDDGVYPHDLIMGLTVIPGLPGMDFYAMMESFFSTLKNELAHRTVYPTRKRARRDIVRYVEVRYNTKRLHSGLGYKTPHEVHDKYLSRQYTA